MKGLTETRHEVKNFLTYFTSVLIMSALTAMCVMGGGIVSFAEDSNPDSINIYYMEEDYKEVLGDVPDGVDKVYQLSTEGIPGMPTFSVVKGDSVTVSGTGLIEPRITTIYWKGNSGSKTYREDYDRIEIRYNPGTSIVRIGSESYTKDITVTVSSYADIIIENRINEIYNECVEGAETELDKFKSFTKWVAENTNYSYRYQSWEDMLIYGGGDCWASTNLILKLCKMAGIDARDRVANQDGFSGSGHRNVLAKIDGKYYVADAGCAGTKPRPWEVEELPSGFSFVKDTDKVIIYQYDGDETDIVVPSEIEGRPVKMFGRGSNLMFHGQTIRSITLPASVEEIGSRAFGEASGIEKIYISADNEYFASDGKVIYTKDRKKLIRAISPIDELVIDKATTTIGSQALSGCKIDNIELPPDLTTLEYNAFYRTYGDSLIVPDQITSFGRYVFEYSGIKNVKLPSNLTTLPECTFKYSNVINVELPEGLTTIEGSAFYQCGKLTGIDIPDSVTTIKGNAFYKCYYLESVDLPKNITSIGKNAFRDNKLWEIYIPKTLTNIGSDALATTLKHKRDIYYEGTEEEWNAIEGIDTAGIDDSMTVHFNSVRVTGIEMDETEIELSKGGSFDITYKILPENATNTNVTVTTDNLNTVKIVGASVTALKEGKAVITVTSNDGHFSKQITITVPHTWDEGVITKTVSCTEDGVMTYTCKDCGETWTEAIKTNGHTEVIDGAVAPTCTQTGLTEGKHCSICNAVLVPQTVVPENGHKWDGGTIVREATEERPGIKRYSCENCDATRDEYFSVNGETIDNPLLIESVSGLPSIMNVGDESSVTVTFNRELLPEESFELLVYDKLDETGNAIVQGDSDIATLNTGKILSIDSEGNIKAVSAGQVTVSYSVNGIPSKSEYTVSVYVKQKTPDAPVVTAITDTSITVREMQGCVYGIFEAALWKVDLTDETCWQTSNVFTGLKPDVTYVIYAKRSEDCFLLESNLSQGTFVPTASKTDSFWPFNDVAESSTLAPDVLAAYNKGIISGYGKPDENGQISFKPEKYVTRAHFAIMIYNMAGKPDIIDTDSTEYNYSDVAADNGARNAIIWASSNGIISGFDGGIYKPDKPISRAQIVMMLKRYGDFTGCSERYMTGGRNINTYDDFDTVGANSAESLQWAIDNGILSGVSNTRLSPNGYARRDQCAAFCVRYYKKFVE